MLNDKPERDAAAKALAEKLAEALQGAENGDELIKRAQAFPAQGFEIKAEKLQFVTADGRLFQHRDAAGFVALPGGYDTGFSRAALAIEHAGQLSPVTKTSFGYHIILLEERAPEQVVPADQLPTLLVPEVEQRRATARAKSCSSGSTRPQPCNSIAPWTSSPRKSKSAHEAPAQRRGARPERLAVQRDSQSSL